MVSITDRDIADPESVDMVKPDLDGFPKPGTALLICKIFEEFVFYGTRSLMIMFLIIALNYSKDDATMLFHMFNVLTYVAPLVGAVISDSWLGRYRTILYLSSGYGAGVICMNLASFTGLDLPSREVFLVGLILTAIFSGVLTPNWVAFGGDQFVLPQQERQLGVFYTFYYMTITVGAFVASALTPVLRADVHCLGMDSCFPLAYGVTTMSMVVALVAFLIGSVWFVKLPASGNVLVDVSKCIWHAAVRRFTHRSTDPKSHWLDHSEARFGPQLVSEVKTLLSILLFYLTFPMFFALEELRASRWTLQSMSLNGDLGFYAIKPDQMGMVSPVLGVILINVWEWAVQPVLTRKGVRMQMRFVVGASLAVISFLIAAGLEVAIQPTAAVMPMRYECQVRIFNGQMCDFELNVDDNRYDVKEFDMYRVSFQVMDGSSTVKNARLVSKSVQCEDIVFKMNLRGATAMSYFVNSENIVTEFEDNVAKDISAKATLRVLVSSSINQTITFANIDADSSTSVLSDNRQQFRLPYAKYFISTIGSNSVLAAEVSLQYAGVYTMLVIDANSTHSQSLKLFEISPPNSVSMLWQLPQYFAMALGTALFVVTCLHFAYTEAPASMKSVLQAVWMLSISAGNLIDVAIVGANFFDSQFGEFMLFALLMFIDCIVMGWLAIRYVNVRNKEVSK